MESVGLEKEAAPVEEETHTASTIFGDLPEEEIQEIFGELHRAENAGVSLEEEKPEKEAEKNSPAEEQPETNEKEKEQS